MILGLKYIGGDLKIAVVNNFDPLKLIIWKKCPSIIHNIRSKITSIL